MKIMKKLAMAFGIVLVLVIAGVVVAIFSINSIARTGVEKGATHALGVPTTLGRVSIGLLSGEAGLGNLDISNPQGFSAPKFIHMGSMDVAVGLRTLTKPTVEIPRFAMDTLSVDIERKDGKTNYGVILDNLAKLSSGKPTSKPGSDEKKFIVRELTITNVKVNVKLLDSAGPVGAVLGETAPITIPINEIKLTDVGKTGDGVGGSGVTISELSSIVVQAIMAAIAENGGGVLPADLLSDLSSRVANLGDLQNLGMSVGGKVSELAGNAGKVAEDAAKKIEAATKEGKKKIEDAADKLKDLLPK